MPIAAGWGRLEKSYYRLKGGVAGVFSAKDELITQVWCDEWQCWLDAFSRNFSIVNSSNKCI
ncbi:MAG: hypothetical protein Q8S55_22375 [Methylococcaceae bacterium]|nr:hypothetical protein [Methylococcaceae bacterium]